MKIKPFSRDAAAGAPSWLLTGTVVLLVVLFSAMIVRDYGRETTAARQTIEEKGSVLIRAGVRHARWHGNADAPRAAAGPAGRDGLAAGRPVVRGD